MSDPAFALRADGNRHYLRSYEGLIEFDAVRVPDRRPCVNLLSGNYVWLADEVHQWFVDMSISYKFRRNNKLGFFIRVPAKYLLIAKLAWG